MGVLGEGGKCSDNTCSQSCLFFWYLWYFTLTVYRLVLTDHQLGSLLLIVANLSVGHKEEISQLLR